MKKMMLAAVLTVSLSVSLSGVVIGGIDTNKNIKEVARYLSRHKKIDIKGISAIDSSKRNYSLRFDDINLPVLGRCNPELTIFKSRIARIYISGLCKVDPGETDGEHKAAFSSTHDAVSKLAAHFRSRFGRERNYFWGKKGVRFSYRVWRSKKDAFERVALVVVYSPVRTLPLVTLIVDSPMYERWAAAANSKGKKPFEMDAYSPSGVMIVSASSWIRPMWGFHFSPPAAMDGNNDTSWQVSAKQWKNSWLEIQKTPRDRSGTTVRYRFSLINGFASRHKKFGDLYIKNSRLRKIRVLWGGNLQFSKTVVLRDNVRTFQEAAVISHRYTGRDLRIRIQILSVYPGKKWRDIAVSEVRIKRVK